MRGMIRIQCNVQFCQMVLITHGIALFTATGQLDWSALLSFK